MVDLFRSGFSANVRHGLVFRRIPAAAATGPTVGRPVALPFPSCPAMTRRKVLLALAQGRMAGNLARKQFCMKRDHQGGIMDRRSFLTRGAIGAAAATALAAPAEGAAPAPEAPAGALRPLSADELSRIEALVKQAVGFDAERGDVVRATAANVHAIENDLAFTRRAQPDDGFERRRLARAVPSQERGDAPFGNRQRDAFENMILTDEGVDGVEFKDIRHNKPVFSG